MSNLRVIAGFDEDGAVKDALFTTEGEQIIESAHDHDIHLGSIYELMTYLGSHANLTQIEFLVQAGSNKDLHVLLLEAIVEGYWEMEGFSGTVFTAAGGAITQKNVNDFITAASDVILTSSPTIVNTTVDALSAAGQKVLNVTATAGFVAEKWVMLDPGEAGVTNNELAQIDTIQAGVSLTMKENLINAYTNEVVQSTGYRIMHVHAEGGTRQAAIGTEASSGGKNVFKADEDYLLRMTNRSASASRISFKFRWAEKTKQT